MTCHKTNPASPMAAGRAGDRFNSLAALNDPQIAQPLISIQADFVARRFGLAPEFGALVANLVFGEARL